MGLFKKKEQKQQQSAIKTFTFIQAPNFRGFSRITLSSQDNIQAISNIDSFKTLNPKYTEDPGIYIIPEGYSISSYPIDKYKFNLKNEEILIETILEDGSPALAVYITGLLVGTMQPSDDKRTDFYNALFAENVEAVHIRIETQMHNKNTFDESGKPVVQSEVRYRVFLFYKKKEV